MKTTTERFMARVNKTEACWLWTGGKTGWGYGQIKINKRNRPAHIVAYELFKGDIYNNLFVLHTCDVPACVNPEHLYLGTHQKNMDDKVARNRQSKGEQHRLKMKEVSARGDKNGARTKPECLARGEKHGTKTHPRKIKQK